MMTPDEYLDYVLVKHHNSTGVLNAQVVQNLLAPHVSAWSGNYLHAINPSGSVAKGTVIANSSDIDLLVSLKHDTPGTLKEMYETLFNRFITAGYSPRMQNVSIGLVVSGLKVDVVPAKKQSAWTNDHSLWSHKHQTYRKTNVHTHIQLIGRSGRIKEIKALKIWRKLHGLELPSFVAEMLVIEATKGRLLSRPAANFMATLEYIRDNILTVRIYDPANSSNVVTDDLTTTEKAALRAQAIDSLSKANWNQIIW